MQYLEAIRVLKARGFQPRRTVHLTMVPGKKLIAFTGRKTGMGRGEREGNDKLRSPNAVVLDS